eukprot:2149738-Amphidinium_carterae.1
MRAHDISVELCLRHISTMHLFDHPLLVPLKEEVSATDGCPTFLCNRASSRSALSAVLPTS